MIRLEGNGIVWHLNEVDGLPALVTEVREEKDRRRSYFSSETAGQGVFVKYFREKGLGGALRNTFFPRGKKEFLVAGKLLSLSVNTPRPLGYGIGKSGSFVLQERLHGTTALSAFDGVEDKGLLLDRLALLLKQLCAQHVRHNDLHLENILITDQTLYVIDLHKTVFTRTRFSQIDELSNLAHSLTMIYGRMTEGQKARFFEVYGNTSIRGDLERRLEVQHLTWVRRKKARAFSDTSRLKTRGSRVYFRGEEGRGDGGPLHVIKHDKKVLVERCTDHIRKVYVHKRRLKKAWENFVVLSYLDLSRVVPRAFFVERGSALGQGFISMEDLGEKGEELDRFLDGRYDSTVSAERRKIARDLAGFFCELLEKRVVHGDLKACNLFVAEGGFVLLDVEDFAFRKAGREDVVRLLVQLNTTIPARIETGDRMAFFRALVRPFPFDKKGLLREVQRRSVASEIVYEGVSGLRKESWTDTRTDRP
jgi:tRNA A-37 threonylcarbamoyl transferase component Bud32